MTDLYLPCDQTLLRIDISGTKNICHHVVNGKDMGDYMPPTSPRKLTNPTSVSRVPWIRNVPTDTFSDMCLFNYGMKHDVKNIPSKYIGYNISYT